MPRLLTHQRLVCYCHRTRQFYYPARIVHGMGPCPYCDAYGLTRAKPRYRRDIPQWHPLQNAIAALPTPTRSALATARHDH